MTVEALREFVASNETLPDMPVNVRDVIAAEIAGPVHLVLLLSKASTHELSGAQSVFDALYVLKLPLVTSQAARPTVATASSTVCRRG